MIERSNVVKCKWTKLCGEGSSLMAMCTHFRMATGLRLIGFNLVENVEGGADRSRPAYRS
jgi:hypothetical protein